MKPARFLKVVRLFLWAITAYSVLQPLPAQAAGELTQSGTLTIEQFQIAFLYSGNLGGGELRVGDRTYDFSIGGLGIGGIGASKITATGEVYNLKKVADFAGAYGQVRIGYALIEKSAGGLWLENTKGVVIHLDADRKGLALSLGADAVYIRLD
jgi:hypothetical protein